MQRWNQVKKRINSQFGYYLKHSLSYGSWSNELRSLQREHCHLSHYRLTCVNFSVSIICLEYQYATGYIIASVSMRSGEGYIIASSPFVTPLLVSFMKE